MYPFFHSQHRLNVACANVDVSESENVDVGVGVHVDESENWSDELESK